MVTTVKLYGDGTAQNPHRANLPTYRLLMANISKGTALVDIPDDVHGLLEDDLKHENPDVTSEGLHVPNLCDDCVKKVNDHFDAKYQEHKGKFRIERV